jgi:hypothetical protein
VDVTVEDCLGDVSTTSSADKFTYLAPTKLTYMGATAGDFNDPATLSAPLARLDNSNPVQGVTVSFTLNGTELCSATTNSSGIASCAVTPGENAGGYTVNANFAGNSQFQASAVSNPFTVDHEDTTLALSGPAFAAKSGSLAVSATLTDPASATEGESASPIAGKTVTLRLGAGASAQTCSGTTNASGTASCTITGVSSQPPVIRLPERP